MPSRSIHSYPFSSSAVRGIVDDPGSPVECLKVAGDGPSGERVLVPPVKTTLRAVNTVLFSINYID
jgi:hypothetical protein